MTTKSIVNNYACKAVVKKKLYAFNINEWLTSFLRESSTFFALRRRLIIVIFEKSGGYRITLLKANNVLHNISWGCPPKADGGTFRLLPTSSIGKYPLSYSLRHCVNTLRATSRSYVSIARGCHYVAVHNTVRQRARKLESVYQILSDGMWLYMFFKFSNLATLVLRSECRTYQRWWIDSRAQHRRTKREQTRKNVYDSRNLIVLDDKNANYVKRDWKYKKIKKNKKKIKRKSEGSFRKLKL